MLIIEEMKKYDLLKKNIDARKMAKEVFLSDFSRSIIKEVGFEPPLANYRTEKILGDRVNPAYPCSYFPVSCFNSSNQFKTTWIWVSVLSGSLGSIIRKRSPSDATS